MPETPQNHYFCKSTTITNNPNSNMRKTAMAIAGIALVCAVPIYGQPPAGYQMPGVAGTLLLGVTCGATNRWIAPGGEDGGESRLRIRHAATEGSRGFAVEVTNLSLPDSARLVWVIGGFDAPAPAPSIAPEHCKDNVFSVEGNSVAVYHGEVMRLRFTKALIPGASDARLCDGRKLTSPATALRSGKRTDAPVLGGSVTMERGKPIYISIGKPSRDADYTYAELPKLFDKKEE